MGVRILSDDNENVHLKCSACGGRPDVKHEQELGEPCYQCGCGKLIEDEDADDENVCTRCGISDDDPRAQQACVAVDSPSPYHRFPRHVEACPQCHKLAVLSDEEAHSVIFEEPVCVNCREKAFHELSMDDFDIAYERARANGWAD